MARRPRKILERLNSLAARAAEGHTACIVSPNRNHTRRHKHTTKKTRRIRQSCNSKATWHARPESQHGPETSLKKRLVEFFSPACNAHADHCMASVIIKHIGCPHGMVLLRMRSHTSWYPISITRKKCKVDRSNCQQNAPSRQKINLHFSNSKRQFKRLPWNVLAYLPQALLFRPPLDHAIGNSGGQCHRRLPRRYGVAKTPRGSGGGPWHPVRGWSRAE